MSLIKFIKKHPLTLTGTALGAAIGGYENENANGKPRTKIHRTLNAIGGGIGLGLAGMSLDNMRADAKKLVEEFEASEKIIPTVKPLKRPGFRPRNPRRRYK